MASAPAACLRRPLSEAQPQLEGARTGLGVLRAQLEADRRPNARERAVQGDRHLRAQPVDSVRCARGTTRAVRPS